MSLKLNSLVLLNIIISLLCDRVSPYLIGTGISDVTGPAAEINMVNYISLMFILMLC